MPVALMGFRPFRAFPSGRSRGASRRPQPSWRWPRVCLAPQTDELDHVIRGGAWRILDRPRRSSSRAPAFRAWHLAGVRLPPHVIRRAAGPMLSWGWVLSRVSRLPDLERLLPATLLPWASADPPFAPFATHDAFAGSGALRSVTRPGDGQPGSHRSVYPPEVLQPRLPSQVFGDLAGPGSWFRLGSRATSPRPVGPSSGQRGPPAGAP